MSRAARVAVAVLAVLVLAWLGVSERATRLTAEAAALSERLEDPGAAARAESALRDARFLNPDTQPDIALAFVAFFRNDEERAVGLIEDVVRREPENLSAWRLLLDLAGEDDPATARRARAALRRLDPVNFARR